MKWVQISDLHYNPKEDGNYTMKARETLPPYLDNIDIGADHLFVTGDYRHARKQRNQPEDAIAKDAVDYILQVAEAAHIPLSNIHIIPGNHDLKRFDDKDEDSKKKLKGIYDKYAQVADPNSFAEDDLTFLNAPFSFFIQVCKTLKQECEKKTAHIDIPWLNATTLPSAIIEENDDFLLLSINSCLFCHTDDSRGKLLVDTCEIGRQLRKFKNIKKPLIVLAHHSITLLDSNNMRQLTDAFDSYQGPILYLCGDAHDYKAQRINDILEVTVGCLLLDDGVTTMTSSGCLKEDRICDIRGYNCVRGRWGQFSQFNEDVADQLSKQRQILENSTGEFVIKQPKGEVPIQVGDTPEMTIEEENSADFDPKEAPYGLLITDITGVLFDTRDDGKEEFSDNIIDVISSLAKSHISICFTTGRGRTGARQLLLNLAQKIIDHDDSITWEDLSRDWTCITHNGAYLLTTPDKSKSGFLANTEKLLSQFLDMRFVNLDAIQREYKEIINRIRNNYNKTVSSSKKINKDRIKWSISSEPVSVRFSLENCPDELCDKIFSETEEICKQAFPNPQHLWFATRGKYEDKEMFEYSMANKNDAIKEYIKRFKSIDLKNIVRLTNGVQDENNENNALSEITVFCVGDCSIDSNNYYPVDENNNRLFGTEATTYILNNLFFYPSFSLKRISSAEKYKMEFADAIGGAKLRSSKVFNYYNSRLAWIDFLYEDNLSANNTSMIFDIKSGAISFSDYEWTRIEKVVRSEKEVIQSNAELQVSYFSDLITKKVDQPDIPEGKPNQMYFLQTDTHVLFRGLLYYYYLAQANATKEGTDSISVEKWITAYRRWVNHALLFSKDFISALRKFDDKKEAPIGYLARKLLIGGFDNIRNILLLLNTFYLRQAIHAEKKEQSDYLVNLEKENSPIFLLCKKISKLLSECLSVMYSALFESQIDSSFPSTAISWLNEVVNLLSVSQHDYDYLEEGGTNALSLFPENTTNWTAPNAFFTECFPRWRESDCFIESVAAIELYLTKVPDITKTIVFWGVPYGSIEHPILASMLCKKHGLESTEYPHYVILHGKYEERHNAEFEMSPDKNYEVSEDTLNVLIDDVVTTGKTIDLCAKIMCLNKVAIDNVIVTRYAGLNRLSHYLTHLVQTDSAEEKTLQASAPDVSKFFNLISGLVSEAPYTKLFAYGTNPEKPYEDVRGVFDKSKQRIKQYIETNY